MTNKIVIKKSTMKDPLIFLKVETIGINPIKYLIQCIRFETYEFGFKFTRL